MTAGVFHITVEQGTDFNPVLTYADPAGVPIDLTGCAAAMMIRTSPDDEEPLVSLSSPSAGIALGGAAGTIAVTIDSAVTAGLPPGAAVYDIKLTDSLGNPMRLLQGNVTISPAVTR